MLNDKADKIFSVRSEFVLRGWLLELSSVCGCWCVV